MGIILLPQKYSTIDKIYFIIILADLTKLPALNFTPPRRSVKAYYAVLDQFVHLNITHETEARTAVQSLLEQWAR